MINSKQEKNQNKKNSFYQPTYFEIYLKQAKEQAEIFNNRFVEGYTCEKCKGKGFIMSVIDNDNELYPHTAVKPCSCLGAKVINSKVE